MVQLFQGHSSLQGVNLILGNNLAGGRAVPHFTDAKKYDQCTWSACAVVWAMSRATSKHSTQDVYGNPLEGIADTILDDKAPNV